MANIENHKFEYAEKKNNFTRKELDDIDAKREEWIDRQYTYFDFADHNALAYDLKKGEIYEIDWGMNINAEFSGRHYGVVLADSNKLNPLVLVCPLKSNHKKYLNRKSDVFIGNIKGLPDTSQTIAVVNQIRAVDKMRVYTKLAIGPKKTNYRLEEDDNVEMKIYRLNEQKLKRILTAAINLLYGLDTRGE